MSALPALDIFDQATYPTRRFEAWRYSDVSRHLRQVPTMGSKINIDFLSGFKAEGFTIIDVINGDYSAVNQATGRVWLRHLSQGEDVALSGHQSHIRLVVPKGQDLVLFETYVGQGAYVAHTQIDIVVENGATLSRLVILDEPMDATSIRRSTMDLQPEATVQQTVLSTGAGFSRFETHVEHHGLGARASLNGGYLLKDSAHFDLTTRIVHSGRDGATDQLIKGLVKDRATGVFQGLLGVERGADGTDARMHHQALILNDGAHIRAKPELEIYADDVACAHGNTIGALDTEALFFCQARGLTDTQARALLTQAFVLPIAQALEDQVLQQLAIEFLTRTTEVYHGL
jgi:Fe-S cluster assembly protein SufD